MNEPHEKNIFQKIIDREVPADIVYEDDKTLAFMDVAPVLPGHVLVIPKQDVESIFDADAETFAALMETVRKLAPAIRDAVGAKGVNINSNHGEAAGQEVMRLHFHVIPRHDRSELKFWPHTTIPQAELQAIAEKIRNQLAN